MKAAFLFLWPLLLINAFGQGTGASRFGLHLGNLTHASAAPYIDSLGAPLIYVRGDVPPDEVGWYLVKSAGEIPRCNAYCDSTRCVCACLPGDYYYSNTALRIPLPAILQSNPLIAVKVNRYDDAIPTTIDSLIGDYPYGHEAEYLAYIDFLLQGYKDSAKYWVAGNENDAPLFWSGTQQEYAGIVALSSGQIRQQCPDCKVGVSFANPDVAGKGGTSLQKHLWYQAMNAVLDTFDFIDAHYYFPSYILPQQLDSLKLYCPGKEFISTETGIPDTFMTAWPGMGSQNAGGTPVSQARDLIKCNTFLFEAGYSKLYWYLIDVDYGTGEIFKHNALVNEDGSFKPAFTSYKTMISKVDRFDSLVRLAAGQYQYTFANKSPVYVLWCDSGSCALPPQVTGNVTVTDYMGSVQVMQAAQVVLDSFPVYVEAGTSSLADESIHSPNNIYVFPDPANTVISISLPAGRETEIEILNLLGEMVIRKTGQYIIDVSGLSRGIYMVHAKHTQGSCIRKFVKL